MIPFKSALGITYLWDGENWTTFDPKFWVALWVCAGILAGAVCWLFFNNDTEPKT